MLVAFVCCVTAAGARYLMLDHQGGAHGRARLVMLVLMLPMLLVITVNLGRLAVLALYRHWPRRGR